MMKVTEKPKAVKTLAVELSEKASETLNDMQAKRQLKDGRRTSLKALANEIIENAKA